MICSDSLSCLLAIGSCKPKILSFHRKRSISVNASFWHGSLDLLASMAMQPFPRKSITHWVTQLQIVILHILILTFNKILKLGPSN
jgi:hypothetical protein